MLTKGKFNYLIFFSLALYSFFINFYYASIGVFPIDTFTFFDTGYSVTIGKHPIKDFWIISGIFGDYLQALFFKIFGVNWKSYVYHSSTLNLTVTLVFYFFLNKLGLKNFESFLFSISLATLCYPVVGTPFTYLHSYLLSIVSLLIFFLGILTNKKIFFLILPIFMFLSFFSMQLPSGLINLIILLSLLYYIFPFKKNWNLIKYFFIGSLISFSSLIFYLLIIGISFRSFLDQYIFFPFSFGFERIVSNENAFEGAKLSKKFNFKSLILDFKFIHIFLFSYFILLVSKMRKYLKDIKKYLIMDITIILSIFCFIFHQLITANQIFIFSLIPLIASLLYLRISQEVSNNKIYKILIILILIFSTVKYHQRFNLDRKFMEFQNIDLSKSVDASLIDQKFFGLKWISPEFSENPLEEVGLINAITQILKKDDRKKMIITHHQFFSSILNEDLNIPNRWYYPDNTFPASKSNTYFETYKSFFINKINNEKIEVIYIIMVNPSIWQNIYLNYFDEGCYETKNVNELLISIDIKNCS